MRRRVDRRTLLVAGGVLLAGCAADPVDSAPRAPRSSPVKSSTPPTPPAPPTPTGPSLPTASAWSPLPDDVEPEAKVAAARVVEALGTVTGDGADPARRLTAVGADPGLAGEAGPLVPPAGPSVTTIVYPQYGGLAGAVASVMVVAEQSWLPEGGGEPVRRTVTADVRLARTRAGWAVTSLRPVPVDDAGAPALTGPAATLAADPRVLLPDAAVADLAAGLVAPPVVDTLLRLSVDFSMSVTVFRAGHPEEVFGTMSTSNHTRGRAVDVWAVDGRPVAGLRVDDPLLLRFLRAATVNGSDEIGGPVVPPGAGAAYFANALHRDHVHIGFD